MPPEPPPPRAIERILVAGGGVAAWLGALALARALPHASVQVVVPTRAKPGPLDLYAGTRPRFDDLLGLLGVDPLRLLAAAGGAWRLGQQFDGWRLEPVLACFGETGATIDRAPFHLAWVRAGGAAAPSSFAEHNPAAALARAGRLPPADAEETSLASAEAAYNFDPALLPGALRAAAVARGIAVVETGSFAVEAAGDRIQAVVTDTGRLEADLFVDAAGPDAPLLSAIEGEWISWADWLPLDRISASESAAATSPLPLDRVSDTGAGWRLEAPLGRRTLHLHIHRTGEANADAVALSQGRRAQPWIGNCVALGDAAVQIEPLGGWPLDLLQFAIERLCDHLTDTAFARVELDEYARVIARHADQLRDHLVVQHAALLGGRPAPLPPMAEATLALFGERGRVPTQDSSPIALEDWLAPLIGGGLVPRQPDPRTDGLQPAGFGAICRTHRAAIAVAVAAAPRHSDALAALRAVA